MKTRMTTNDTNAGNREIEDRRQKIEDRRQKIEDRKLFKTIHED